MSSAVSPHCRIHGENSLKRRNYSKNGTSSNCDRSTNSVVEALGWRNVTMYYWSDSTTVLAGILREENWSIFVGNKVQEIKKLGNPTPVDMNPADLTSRGCKAKRIVYS
ncbi:integrase catalytic domain-containing protein [Trichonephila clavipes]|uniref:Integrase catalytic domain-containing protein n=1 Tax=Trichonephila clavipes TaxID=2585209 RepID=A0A8X6WEZ0_TRICX|nr:integrase catalytic domain-containing protein [Trichonephila clavipes]